MRMLTGGIISILLTIYFAIIVIVDLISWIIYVLLLFFLIRCRLKNDKVISKEFFTLCIFNGILDILFVIEEYVNFRIPQFGFFEHFYQKVLSHSKIAGICYTYSLCQVVVISMSGITLTFNRYYAIKYPIKYKEFWSGWRLALLTVWPIIIVIPIFIIFYDSKVDFIIDKLTGRLTQNFVDQKVNDSIWTTTITMHIISLLVNGILNVLLVKTIRKEVKKSRTSLNNANSDIRIDIAMAKYAFVHFLFFGMIVILEIGIATSFKHDYDSLAFNGLTLFVLAETIMVFFSPYALLILSKDIRIRFFSFLGLQKVNKLFRTSNSTFIVTNKQPNPVQNTNKNVSSTVQPQYQNLISKVVV